MAHFHLLVEVMRKKQTHGVCYIIIFVPQTLIKLAPSERSKVITLKPQSAGCRRLHNPSISTLFRYFDILL